MSTMLLIIGAWCSLLRSERGCSEIFLMSRAGLSICFFVFYGWETSFIQWDLVWVFRVCLGMDICHFETRSVEKSPAKCYTLAVCCHSEWNEESHPSVTRDSSSVYRPLSEWQRAAPLKTHVILTTVREEEFLANGTRFLACARNDIYYPETERKKMT